MTPGSKTNITTSFSNLNYLDPDGSNRLNQYKKASFLMLSEHMEIFDHRKNEIPKTFFADEETEALPLVYQLWSMINHKLRQCIKLDNFDQLMQQYIHPDEQLSHFYVGSLSDGNPYYFFGSTKGNLIFMNL